MTDPRQTAAALLGKIDWQSEVCGFCRCPGEALHTHPTDKKDCRVSVNGAPTIYCFHASCEAAAACAGPKGDGFARREDFTQRGHFAKRWQRENTGGN